MVKITGNFGKVKSWINRLIRVKAIGNTFVGVDAGKVSTGNYNNFMGYQAGYSNTSGHSNNFMGRGSGYHNSAGYRNNFLGEEAGYFNTTGASNNFVGHYAGVHNTTGQNNTFVGSKSGYGCITGWRGIHIGYEAGYYEVNGDRLIVDNDKRADSAAEQANAILYGLFAAVGAPDQRLSINARLLVRTVPTYADDAAAGTGGLATGEVYKHADGSVHIKL